MKVTVKELVEYIARTLVDQPEQVTVTETVQGNKIILRLSVAESDKGRIIGKQGKVANAIRALLRVAATQRDQRVELEIE